MAMTILSIALVPQDILWIHYPLDALGAQDFELAWIFNYGLMIGGGLIILIVTLYHHKMSFPQAITYTMLGFGLSMILMGVWQTGNAFEYNPEHIEEALSHQRFYNLTYISYVTCVLSHIILSKSKKIRRIHVLTCMVLGILYLISRITTSFQGLMDLAQGLIILLWIPVFFGRFEYIGNINRF